jgi:hypothetical protein
MISPAYTQAGEVKGSGLFLQVPYFKRNGPKSQMTAVPKGVFRFGGELARDTI